MAHDSYNLTTTARIQEINRAKDALKLVCTQMRGIRRKSERCANVHPTRKRARNKCLEACRVKSGSRRCNGKITLLNARLKRRLQLKITTKPNNSIIFGSLGLCFG